ncbi:MAG: heme-binding domain-containing protein [Chitinophagaceae bacterium]|nr:heme-binding domain-containing protein [Chitinophagaceae bacterium]
MKNFFKKLFFVLLLAFIAIQFFRPAKNKAEGVSANDITTKYTVPQDVQAILKTSCYDCHSNNTNYPWYSQIQPVAWWLDDHIKEGKRELNFSEFATYRIGRQYKKLEEINKEVKEGEMPLSSYTLIHKDAIPNDQQKLSLANWVTTLRDSIKAQYPEDSLKRPQKKPEAK